MNHPRDFSSALTGCFPNCSGDLGPGSPVVRRELILGTAVLRGWGSLRLSRPEGKLCPPPVFEIYPAGFVLQSSDTNVDPHPPQEETRHPYINLARTFALCCPPVKGQHLNHTAS